MAFEKLVDKIGRDVLAVHPNNNLEKNNKYEHILCPLTERTTVFIRSIGIGVLAGTVNYAEFARCCQLQGFFTADM
jgi:hypothetical protein